MVQDLELVKEVLKGNISCFNTLLYRYEAPIFKFAYGIVKDSEAAKDITQEVFIAVYNKLYLYREQNKFSNWIFQIARNKSLDHLRKRKGIIQLDIEMAWNIASKELLPEQCVEFKETKAELEKFINGLDEVERQILLMKGLKENFKFIDIAEVLKMNESTVKTKYYRLWDKFNSFVKNNEKRCRV